MLNKADKNAFLVSKYEFLATIDNHDVPMTAFIRKPFEADDQRWICAASIAGIFHRKADLTGTSADQAIRSAQQFLQQELNGYISGGGKLSTTDHQPLNDVSRILISDAPDNT